MQGMRDNSLKASLTIRLLPVAISWCSKLHGHPPHEASLAEPPVQLDETKSELTASTVSSGLHFRSIKPEAELKSAYLAALEEAMMQGIHPLV